MSERTERRKECKLYVLYLNPVIKHKTILN